jgi:type I restriction enzyme, S subunit
MTQAWESVRLKQVLKRTKKEIDVDDLQTYKRLTIRMKGLGVDVRDQVLGAQIGTKRQFLVDEGQFILSKIDARNGAFGIIPKTCTGGIITGNFWVFDVEHTRLDSQYFNFLTKTHQFIEFCIKASEGTTNRLYLQESKFLEQKIPLPPLEEQRRIVARVESLAAQIAEARGLREAATVESILLFKSKRQQMFTNLAEKFKTERLGYVCHSQLGKMLSEKSKTGIGTTPYLRNANVQWDRFDLSSVYTMDFDAREFQKFLLEPDDILVCEGGDIGKCAIWSGEIANCCYQKALHRLRVHKELLVPRYLLHHLIWAAKEGHFLDLKTQTTIPHLPAIKLNSYPIILADLATQKNTVQELDSLKSQISALEQLQEATRLELEALLPSVLAKAFAGEL